MKADLEAYDQRHRSECVRCFRPSSECYCHTLASLTPRTRVLFLQHPRERSVAIGTARMTHLALSNSALRTGVSFADDSVVQAALAEPSVALLFPADAAPKEIAPEKAHLAPNREANGGDDDVQQWKSRPPHTLIVIDGTWSQAKALLRVNPALLALPKVTLRPSAPGNYRIRKEPDAAFLSTVEAVSQTLEAWEGESYRALLRPFEFLVDRQVAAAATAPRFKARRQRRDPTFPELAPLLDQRKRAVVLYAEANRHPRHLRPEGAPELVHLVALRLPSSAAEVPDALDIVLRPRRRMAPDLGARLGLPDQALVQGRTVAEAKAAFAAFFDPRSDLLCTWGQGARDVLAADAFGVRGFVDVRALAARHLGRKAGGLAEAHRALCPADRIEAGGARAAADARRVAAIVRTLLEHAGRHSPHSERSLA